MLSKCTNFSDVMKSNFGTLLWQVVTGCVAVLWRFVWRQFPCLCGCYLTLWRQFPCLCGCYLTLWRQFPCLWGCSVTLSVKTIPMFVFVCVAVLWHFVWRQFLCCVCVCLCGCSVALCLFPCLCCCSVALCLKTVPLFMSVLWCFVWRSFPYFVYGREKVNTLEFCLKERSVERPPCLIPPAHSGTGF